ncbi:hypothetical protein BDR03DRAFT_646787 [Suillus americanus]|nr:hypothetical protein BDR03DRAFT_646787 [Suillus americanus]
MWGEIRSLPDFYVERASSSSYHDVFLVFFLLNMQSVSFYFRTASLLHPFTYSQIFLLFIYLPSVCISSFGSALSPSIKY